MGDTKTCLNSKGRDSAGKGESAVETRKPKQQGGIQSTWRDWLNGKQGPSYVVTGREEKREAYADTFIDSVVRSFSDSQTSHSNPRVP